MKHKYINEFLGWPIFIKSKNLESNEVFVSSNSGDTDIGWIGEVYFDDLKNVIDKYHDLILEVNDINDDVLYQAITNIRDRIND